MAKQRLLFLLKFLIILIIGFLVVLGLLFSVILYNYNFRKELGTDFRSRYFHVLSEKITMDGWLKYQKYFNAEFGQNREIGEFRRQLVSNELSNGKIKSYGADSIGGTVFKNGMGYYAEINPNNFELKVSSNPDIWHWKWYNWLGFGLDKVHGKTIEEIVNSSLP